MQKFSFAIFPLLASLLLPSASFAGSESTGRTRHRFGAYLGFIGDPFPTLVGGNIGVNIFSFLRLVGGYGSISAGSLTATTIGGGTRFFIPGWNLSPMGGLSYANVSVSGASALGSTTVGGFNGSAGHLYATAGLDWQANIGFNIAVGYNYSLKSGVGGLPFVNIGWFF